MTTVIRAEVAADGTRTTEITWDDGADPSLDDVLRVLNGLGPDMRPAADTTYSVRFSQSVDPADICRRSRCGHPRAYHPDAGMCEACGCAGFLQRDAAVSA